MLELVLNLVGTIILMAGVIMIYDARQLTKKLFSFGDQNEGTLTLKIVGFVISIVACILIMI